MPNLPPKRSAVRWLIAIVAGLAAAVGAVFWAPQLLCGPQSTSAQDPAGTAYASCIDSGMLLGGLTGLLLGVIVSVVLLRLLHER